MQFLQSRRAGMSVAFAMPILCALSFAAMQPALAADIGSECCADLEVRIAELEATAARKGNRKVSLTISGYVAQELTFWDDGRDLLQCLHSNVTCATR